VNPIDCKMPMPITTDRIIIRPSIYGDEEMLNRSVNETQLTLKKWMPWAQEPQTLEETNNRNRQNQSNWILRTDMFLMILDKETGEHIGCTGFHRLNWEAGRFEVGYWIRDDFSGKGYITEATNALCRYAFAEMGANRVEIKCDSTNEPSRAVPLRLGFEFEATIKKDTVAVDRVSLRDTCIYARFNCDGLPDIKVRW
jgi:ribosomal-protein-serine acetyltransferase